METTQNKIAKKAYYKYLEKGSKNGEDVNDWLEAEKEVKKEVASSKKPAKTSKTAATVGKTAKLSVSIATKAIIDFFIKNED